MIIPVDWDTAFFGYTVGKIILKDYENPAWDELKINTGRYRLLYIFSKNELSDLPDNCTLVDKKITFIKPAQLYINEQFENIIEYTGYANSRLRDLAFQSGSFSRFKKDNNFRNNEFEKLYTEWIEKSLDHSIADSVFIYKTNPINGFVTLKFGEEYAEIGLIAVDSILRGKGIGTELIRYSVDAACRRGCKFIKVSTQEENIIANKLYQKNEFFVTEETLIYHYWS